jgi:uncharacterized protein (TIGR02466 family)
MNTAYFDSLFPTFVVYSDSENLISNDLITLSKKLLLDYGTKPFYSPCISTVEKMGGVLELPEFAKIKERIIFTIDAYAQKLNLDKSNLTFSCSWLNLYEKHGYQDLHTHPESLISGVIYLKSEGNKDLVFQSNAHFYQPVMPIYTQKNLENCVNVEYPSIEGRCYIFPSHALHRTLPAQTERISLSFNVTYMKN